MNNTERVAALEALLGRVQRNATVPRVSWRAEAPSLERQELSTFAEPKFAEPTFAEPAPAKAQPAPQRPIIEREERVSPVPAPVAPKPAPAAAPPVPAFRAEPARASAPAKPAFDSAPKPAAAQARPLGGGGVRGFGGGAGAQRPVARVESPKAPPAAPKPESPIAPPVAAKPEAVKPAPAIQAAPVLAVQGLEEPMEALDLPIVEPPAPEPAEVRAPSDPFGVTRPADGGEIARMLADAVAKVPPPPPAEPEPAAFEPALEPQPVAAPEPEPPAATLAAEPIAEPAPAAKTELMPKPEPAPVAAAPEPAQLSPEPPPSFTSASEEAPSKFAAEPVELPRRKSSLPYLLVAAFVAICVGAAVIIYLQSKDDAPPQPKSEPTTAPTATATVTAAATTTATATATAAATTATATAEASAEASASASASAGPDSPPTDPKTLPPTKGYLFVKMEGEGTVFTSGGKKLGDANSWLEVMCNGGKGPFVAVAKAGTTAPRGGKVVPVGCQSSATVEFTAAELNAPPPTPAPGPAIPVQPGVTAPPPPPPPPVNPQEP